MIDGELLERPAIADGLFEWPSTEPRLRGSRCTSCSCVTFPAQESCPRCTGETMAPEVLPRRGTLWTWTVQGFPPKSPPYAGDDHSDDWVPFGLGYVELGDVRVEGRLTESRPERLRIGMEMEVVAVPFGDAVTYAFAPAEETP